MAISSTFSSNNPVKFFQQALHVAKGCAIHWPVILASVASFTLLGAFYAYFRQPMVEVKAQLKLPMEENSGTILSLNDLFNNFSISDMLTNSADNEMQMLGSHAVFNRVAREMELNVACYRKEGFLRYRPMLSKPTLRIKCSEDIADTLSVDIVFTLKRDSDGLFAIKAKAKKKCIWEGKGLAMPAVITTPYGVFEIDKTEYFDSEKSSSTYRIEYSSYSIAAQNYAEKVKIFTPNKKTDFIDLAYITSDAKFGKRLLNEIIDSYNIVCSEQKNFRSGNDLAFLDQRISALDKELASEEEKMEQFMKANKLTNPKYDLSALLQKNSELEALSLESNTRAEILKLTVDFLSNPDNGYSLLPALVTSSQQLGDEGMANDLSAYNQMVLKRMRLHQGVKKPTPSMLLLDDQIERMRENIISSAKQALANANLAKAKVRDENSAALQRMKNVPQIEREYAAMERELVLKQQLYLFLLKQREEANMEMIKQTPWLVTVDKPYVLRDEPGLSSKLALFLAILLGLAIGVGWVALFKMGNVPYGPAIIQEAKFDAPVLGSVGIRKEDRSDGFITKNLGIGTRKIRNEVVAALSRCDGKVVLITSRHEDEGKDLFTIDFASSIAVIGKKTLLIDDSIIGKEKDTIAPCESIENLWLWRVPSSKGNSADALASVEFSDNLGKWRKSFDCIIINSAPLEKYADSYVLSGKADLTLVVVDAETATKNEVEYINSLVKEGRLPRIAIVITRNQTI